MMHLPFEYYGMDRWDRPVAEAAWSFLTIWPQAIVVVGGPQPSMFVNHVRARMWAMWEASPLLREEFPWEESFLFHRKDDPSWRCRFVRWQGEEDARELALAGVFGDRILFALDAPIGSVPQVVDATLRVATAGRLIVVDTELHDYDIFGNPKRSRLVVP